MATIPRQRRSRAQVTFAFIIGVQGNDCRVTEFRTSNALLSLTLMMLEGEGVLQSGQSTVLYSELPSLDHIQKSAAFIRM